MLNTVFQADASLCHDIKAPVFANFFPLRIKASALHHSIPALNKLSDLRRIQMRHGRNPARHRRHAAQRLNFKGGQGGFDFGRASPALAGNPAIGGEQTDWEPLRIE